MQTRDNVQWFGRIRLGLSHMQCMKTIRSRIEAEGSGFERITDNAVIRRALEFTAKHLTEPAKKKERKK